MVRLAQLRELGFGEELSYSVADDAQFGGVPGYSRVETTPFQTHERTVARCAAFIATIRRASPEYDVLKHMTRGA